PRAVMAAAADGNLEALFTAKIHGRDHVRDIAATGDQLRVLVDHAVIELARFVVIGIAAPDHDPAQLLLQLDFSFLAHMDLLIAWTPPTAQSAQTGPARASIDRLRLSRPGPGVLGCRR